MFVVFQVSLFIVLTKPKPLSQTENQRLQQELRQLQKVKCETPGATSSDATCNCFTEETRLKV